MRPDVHDAALLHDMLSAARGVSDAFRAAHPEVPWRPIMATRHILAHDYDEVNHDIVWRIVQDHMPPLIAQLESLLAEVPPPPER